MNRNKLTLILSIASVVVGLTTFILSSNLSENGDYKEIRVIAESSLLNYGNPLPRLNVENRIVENRAESAKRICYLSSALSISTVENEEPAVEVIDNSYISSNFSPTLPVREEYFIISSPMGERVNPTTQVDEYHFGVDIESSGIEGQNVFSVLPGVVSNISESENLGTYIVIKHGELSTLYGNLNKNEIKVAIGQRVFSGDTIGIVGVEGCGNRALLHFELDKNGERMDPMILFEEKLKERELND